MVLNPIRSLFWTLVFASWNAVGAQSTTRFDHISVDDGLSQNAVTWVTQDRRGFIWIATHDGLNRYDGYEIKVYRNDPFDANSLSDNAIQMVVEDQDGMFWIATMEGGVNRLNPDTDKVTRYRHDPQDANSLGFDGVFSVLPDGRERLWINHGAGTDLLNRETDEFTHFVSPHGSLFEDKTGSIWLYAWPHDLFLFDEIQARFVAYDLPFSETTDESPTLAYVAQSGILLIVYPSRIEQFDLTQRKFIERPIQVPSPMLLNHVVMAIEDSSGKLLLATMNSGMMTIDPQTQSFSNDVHNPYDPTSLSNNILYHLFEDRSGIIWISTEGGGVNLKKKDKWKFPLHQHLPNCSHCISSNYVTAIHAAPDGDLWVGTRGGGLNRMDRKTGIVHTIRHDPTRKNHSLSNDAVNCISPSDEPGILWIGTHEGLNRLNINSHEIECFRHDPSQPGSISANLINNVFTDSRGTLWVVAYTWLDRRRKGEATFTRFPSVEHDPDGISLGPGGALYEDRSNTLWIGSWGGGLNRYDAQRDGFDHFVHDPNDLHSLSHNRVWAITEDSQRRLWIGTYGGGLNLFDRSSETFTRFSQHDGLANNVIYAILEAERGHLWMSTNRGLSRFDPETRSFTNYDTHDGVQGNEFNSGAFCQDDRGIMYFGGVNGFNAFVPSRIKTNPHVPPLVITSLSISGEEMVFDRPIDTFDTLEFAHHENHVSFEFAALDYNVPSKNRYAFKLEPLEHQWSEVPADRRFADYRNLAAGRYTFRVKGTNNDGVWNDRGTAFSFFIHPPFWGTWWFRTLALMSFGFVFYGAINLLKKYAELIEFWRTKHIIGDYRVVEKLGSGGMGTVYKGIKSKHRSKIVALKVLHEQHFSQEIQRRRFLNEGHLIDDLDHPNIVKIFERGVHGNTLFIAMEYLDGVTLQERIEASGMLSETEATGIMLQLADVLAVLHKKGVVHRDLKPENIVLIEKDGHRDVVKVLDFGLAKVQDVTRLTKSGTFMGTIGYTPPEQIAQGEFEPPGDIFALGVVFYEMVTGERPFFGATSLEIMKQVLQEDPLPPRTFNPHLSQHLDDLIGCMLDKDPAGRPTADDLMEMLTS